jgi:hypothetical protein
MSVKAFEFVAVIETLQQRGERAQTKVIMDMNIFVNYQMRIKIFINIVHEPNF